MSRTKTKPKGLLRLSEVETLETSSLIRVSSGISGLDKILGGFMMGQVSIWTGVNASGKSTLLGQILIEAIHQGFGVCAFSGELPAPLFRHWIELQMAGPKHLEKTYDKMKQDYVYHVPEEVSERLRNWYKDKFFLIDSSGSSGEDDLLNTFEYAATKLNCRVFMVDNLMTTGFRAGDYYRGQSKFIGRLVDFAHKHSVHVHVVAHPRKVRGMVTKMDISGSGDITNRADNVFVVTRFKPREEVEYFEGCDSALHVLKNRFSGKQDLGVGLLFDQKSKRFCMKGDKVRFNKEYG
jgi:twinkle protein